MMNRRVQYGLGPRLRAVYHSPSNRRYLLAAIVELATLCSAMRLLWPSLAVQADHRDEGRLERIKYIIVIYQENWSFDSLYGLFPGANGLANSGPKIPQVDKNDNSIQPLDATGKIDARFPPANGQPSLPVKPFNLTKFVQPDQTTGDLIHRYYHEQLQINGGKLNKFVIWSDNGGLVFSYFDATNLPEGKLARQYVICDNFFHSAFGGSFLNHQYLIAAAPPVWPDAPANAISNPDPSNLNDARVTPDGFAVNTAFTINTPHPKNITDPLQLVPEQTNPTIGDRLSRENISWKWYSGGWNNALAGNPDPLFQFHHQPFAYYKRYSDGTQAKLDHLQDETDFFNDLTSGHLPAVSFIKPLGPDNEHPVMPACCRASSTLLTLSKPFNRTDMSGSTAPSSSPTMRTVDAGTTWHPQ